MTDKTQTATMPNQPNIPTFATDSEAIRYATLSNDLLTRRLAELAAAAAELWQDLPEWVAEWIAEGNPDAIEEIYYQHGEFRRALDFLDVLDVGGDVAEAVLDYLKNLDRAVQDGKLYYIEDCAHCDATGLVGGLHKDFPDWTCDKCKGRGVILEAPELP